MNGCPQLSDPVLVDSLYVYFYCEVSHNYTDVDDAVFEVRFLFDQEIDDRVPQFEMRGGDTRVGLHEKYLHGNLGKRVCTKITEHFTFICSNDPIRHTFVNAAKT